MDLDIKNIELEDLVYSYTKYNDEQIQSKLANKKRI